MPINEDALKLATASFNCTLGDLQAERPVFQSICKRIIETYLQALPVVSDEELLKTITDNLPLNIIEIHERVAREILQALKQRGHL